MVKTKLVLIVKYDSIVVRPRILSLDLKEKNGIELQSLHCEKPMRYLKEIRCLL